MATRVVNQVLHTSNTKRKPSAEASHHLELCVSVVKLESFLLVLWDEDLGVAVLDLVKALEYEVAYAFPYQRRYVFVLFGEPRPTSPGRHIPA